MTATIRPPKGPSRRPTLRFSSLESLGFSDAAHTWSEPPAETRSERRGRHETTVADQRPVDFGSHLDRGDIRWSLVALGALAIAALIAFGYWLYQRPATIEEAARSDLTATADDLAGSMAALFDANTALTEPDGVYDGPAVAAAESQARALFDLSGSVQDFEVRSVASEAAEETLAAVRLLRESGSYRAAVAPSLAAPQLETDPDAIALDEAARSFGDWQLSFTSMLGALPDGVLPQVTQRLDAISTDLTRVLGEYVDALREDDQQAASRALSTLDARLGEVREALEVSIRDVQSRVGLHLDEASRALAGITG